MQEIVEIPLVDITVSQCHRRDLGDIAALAASIQRHGLLQPMVVATDLSLVVGRRRLAAYELLGWETIPARVIDLANPLGAEYDENTLRKAFTPSERVAIAEAMEAQVRESAQERQREAGKKHGRGKIAPGNLPEAIETQPPTRDIIAARVGWSGRTYEKAKMVVEAAQENPQAYADLIERMDATGNVHGAWRRLPGERRQRFSEPLTPKAPPTFTIETILGGFDQTFHRFVPSFHTIDAAGVQQLEYRTTYFLHQDYQTNSPNRGKYRRHDNFLRVLKRLEAFRLYVEQGDIVILQSWEHALTTASKYEEVVKNKALSDAFRAVNGRTLYLVSATIQVALWHHLDEPERRPVCRGCRYPGSPGPRRHPRRQQTFGSNYHYWLAAAPHLAKSPVSMLAMASNKAVVIMARDTRIKPYSQLALALPVA
jgi:ParB family chromosome partitioning protein